MQFTKGNIEGVEVIKLEKHVDDRGFLVETVRQDILPAGRVPEMAYVSITEPGVARGPHEQEDQTDIFSFLGPGNFKITLWDNRSKSSTFRRRMVLFDGQDNPLTLIVPPGVVHAYRNISTAVRGMVLNCPNRLYAGWDKKEPVDEIRHEDSQDEFYQDFRG